jgi:hypothetical protein
VSGEERWISARGCAFDRNPYLSGGVQPDHEDAHLLLAEHALPNARELKTHDEAIRLKVIFSREYARVFYCERMCGWSSHRCRDRGSGLFGLSGVSLATPISLVQNPTWDVAGGGFARNGRNAGGVSVRGGPSQQEPGTDTSSPLPHQIHVLLPKGSLR